jgi:hypothetical protein
MYLLSYSILMKFITYIYIYMELSSTLDSFWHHNYIFTSYAYSDEWQERGEFNASCMNDVGHLGRWEVWNVVG